LNGLCRAKLTRALVQITTAGNLLSFLVSSRDDLLLDCLWPLLALLKTGEFEAPAFLILRLANFLLLVIGPFCWGVCR
jgi:hypothetical protein